MKALLLWAILAQGADLATTGIGLHRGCQEAMWPWRHAPKVGMMVKGGGTIYVGIALPLLHRRRPALSKGLALGLALSGTGAALSNLTQLPRC